MTNIIISKEQMNMHNIIFGQVGSGKSMILQRYADENNISYEEAEKMSQPSAEEVQRAEKEKTENQLNDEKRLLATKLAYWDNSAFDKWEFSNFSEQLSCQLEVEDPTNEQIKMLFLMIPDDLFGMGVSYGFGDSVARDNLYEFVENNIDLIKSKLREL
jgi:hypothetical protein